MTVSSKLPEKGLEIPIKKSSASNTIIKKSSYTYPTSTFTKPSAKPALIDDWPPKLKDIEYLIKYPSEKEEPPMPSDWKDTVSEEGDPSVTMPSKKTTLTSSMTTLPGKSSKKDYDYPYISIEGEDGKLAKLFKSIPKD
jgi:hypothetical protein